MFHRFFMAPLALREAARPLALSPAPLPSPSPAPSLALPPSPTLFSLALFSLRLLTFLFPLSCLVASRPSRRVASLTSRRVPHVASRPSRRVTSLPLISRNVCRAGMPPSLPRSRSGPIDLPFTYSVLHLPRRSRDGAPVAIGGGGYGSPAAGQRTVLASRCRALAP